MFITIKPNKNNLADSNFKLDRNNLFKAVSNINFLSNTNNANNTNSSQQELYQTNVNNDELLTDNNNIYNKILRLVKNHFDR